MKVNQILAILKKAIRGEETQDFTSGKISEDVILLAVPMILELSFESIFAVVDIFFVSKLGSKAIATVGLTESVITIVYSFAIGLSTAATALVARRVGEKDFNRGAYLGAQSIVMGIILSIIIGAFGICFAEEILSFMGAKPDVVAEGAIFTKIMMGASVSIMLLFLINGVFRGAGNAVMAMRSLWIASIVNIILCPILIHYYGLKGAAIATVIGRTTGVIYQLYHLIKGNGILKFKTDYFRIDFSAIKDIIDIAWPATFQFIIASGSWILMAKIVADTGGTEASAGYQIAVRNVIFFILPAWGMSNAAATLVGQNLGANKPERAQESVLLASKYNTYFMGFVTLLFVGIPSYIISLFTQDATLIHYGSLSLRIMGTGYVFYGIAMVMMSGLNGAGDTRTPTWINFVGFWLFQIPLAYFLSSFMDLKATGAYIAIPVAESFIALIAYYYFKKGDWKKIKI
jgi:putative MATE family efflux protein